MACAVAGPLWEQEMGARELMDKSSVPTVVPVKRKIAKDSEKRKRKRSPFRPWTPELHASQSAPPTHHPPPPSTVLREDDNSRDDASSMDGSSPRPPPPPSVSSSSQRRNYKNMTRERRIEANARERTRVHTISAAFENLRRAVPAYSHNQKLSKLAVLRVAASYIMTLSRLIDEDYSLDHSEPTLESCIESITSTIQMEGRLKKKKDD